MTATPDQIEAVARNEEQRTMNSNDLIAVMREFGLEVRMLGPLDNPNPSSKAISAMLEEIVRLRAVRERIESAKCP